MPLFLSSSYCDQSWAIGGDEKSGLSNLLSMHSQTSSARWAVSLKYLLPSALISARSPGLDILAMTVLIDLAIMGNSTLAFSPGNA
jgi:hypothetical protein